MKYLAYSEVQLKGRTLYLHELIAAKNKREAIRQFSGWKTEDVDGVVIQPKGFLGQPIKGLPKKIAQLLSESGRLNQSNK